MFSNEIADQITGRLSTRFDGIPKATLRSVIRETLVARETIHSDATHVRADGADTPAPATPAPETPKPVNRDAALERSRAYRDEAGAALSQQWKKGA